MTTPAKVYESRLATLAIASGPPKPRYPLPEDCLIQFAAYAFDQEFEMLEANFPPAPKNTASNAITGGSAVFAGLMDANAILTKLTQPAPTGGGRAKFSASFNRVPASWNDFKTQSVTFPGWIDNFKTGLGRAPVSHPVTIRIRHDYFVIDPASLIAGALDSGGNAVVTVSDKSKIPIIERTPWLNTIYTSGYAANPNSEVTSLVKTGGYSPSATFGIYQETCPPTDIYQDWCAVAVAFRAGSVAWDNTHPPQWDGVDLTTTTYGQYILQSSQLVEYAGNIIDRQTIYAMPE